MPGLKPCSHPTTLQCKNCYERLRRRKRPELWEAQKRRNRETHHQKVESDPEYERRYRDQYINYHKKSIYYKRDWHTGAPPGYWLKRPLLECECCAHPLDEAATRKSDRPMADHCHIEKLPRGWLCMACNVYLGVYEFRKRTGILGKENPLFEEYLAQWPQGWVDLDLWPKCANIESAELIPPTA